MENRLRNIREDKDMKLYEVANRVGCNRMTLYRYEMGFTSIKTCTLIQLAKLYNVSCDYILKLINVPKKFPECENSNEIYTRLRYLRRKSHLSELEVALTLKCRQEEYSRFENGSAPISLDMIVDLSKLYDVSTDYIILGAE